MFETPGYKSFRSLKQGDEWKMKFQRQVVEGKLMRKTVIVKKGARFRTGIELETGSNVRIAGRMRQFDTKEVL